MKSCKKIWSGMLAAGLLIAGLAGCEGKTNDELLYAKYNYDLTTYMDLGEYKGLEANTYDIAITEERVRQEINAVIHSYAKETSAKDGAAVGYTMTVDYTASGENVTNSTAENVNFTLGGGKFPSTFENALVGHRIGDKVAVDVPYPDTYEDKPEYAGKTIHYEITIKDMKALELPIYNDDFARGYLGYDSIADFEAAVEQQLRDSAEESLMKYLVNQTWEQVMENTTVKEYPAAEVDALYRNTLEANQANAALQGISFNSYLSVFYNTTVEEYTDALMADARAMVKEEMIIYAIARAENITLSDEEYTERATEYALNVYGLDSLEQFEEEYDKDAIRVILLGDKVREFVANSATKTIGDAVNIVG